MSTWSTDSAYVNADNVVLHMMWAPSFSRWLFLRSDYISQPAVFVRRSALAGDPLLDESFHFAMDYELWLRLLARGCRFARLDRVLSFDRVQLERKTRTMVDTRQADAERLATTYGVVGGTATRLMLRPGGIRLVGSGLLSQAYVRWPLMRRCARSTLLRGRSPRGVQNAGRQCQVVP
jgi:hypothetical protein